MQESVGMSDSGNHWKSQRSWFFYRTIVISFFCTLFLLTSGDQPPVLMRTKCYTCVCLSVKSLQLCLTLYNPVACGQAPLSMRFSRQKYWSGWEWDRSLNPAGFRIFPTQGSNWHLFTSTCIGRQIGDSVVKKKKSACNTGDAGTQVWFPGLEDLLEEKMATHSSVIDWRTPWTEGYRPWDCRVGNLATDFLSFFPLPLAPPGKHMGSTVTVNQKKVSSP